jgi:hypothetical protein
VGYLCVVVAVLSATGQRDDVIQMPLAPDLATADTADTLVAVPYYVSVQCSTLRVLVAHGRHGYRSVNSMITAARASSLLGCSTLGRHPASLAYLAHAMHAVQPRTIGAERSKWLPLLAVGAALTSHPCNSCSET